MSEIISLHHDETFVCFGSVTICKRLTIRLTTTNVIICRMIVLVDGEAEGELANTIT